MASPSRLVRGKGYTSRTAQYGVSRKAREAKVAAKVKAKKKAERQKAKKAGVVKAQTTTKKKNPKVTKNVRKNSQRKKAY